MQLGKSKDIGLTMALLDLLYEGRLSLMGSLEVLTQPSQQSSLVQDLTGRFFSSVFTDSQAISHSAAKTH